MAGRNNTSDPNVVKARVNRGGAGLKYPPELDSQPNFFSINMREYSTAFAAGSKGGEYFHLPIPINGLEDKFDIRYTSQDMGAIGGVGSSIMDNLRGGTIIGGLAAGVGGIAQALGEAAGAAIGDVLPGVGAARGAAASQLVQGSISNPNLAAVFKGVDLRRHTFRWKMIAYNSNESSQIDQMVTKLKQRALPERELNGNFVLKYPHIAYLYMVGPKGNGLITFSEKGAFIEHISASYNGQSHPSFFIGTNSPVEVELSISFIERSIVAAQDIGG